MPIETYVFLGLAIVFWLFMALKHPWATLVCVALAFVTPDTHILNALLGWTVFAALFVTSFGRHFLGGFIVGFVVNMFISSMKKS